MAKKHENEQTVVNAMDTNLSIHFVVRDNGPERLVAEAEVLLPEPMKGLKLVGFSLWQGPSGEVFVTFPARAFGAGSDRKFFDFLRAVDGDMEAVKAVKAAIVAAWQIRCSTQAA